MFDVSVESIKVFFSGIIAGGVTLMGTSFKYIGILVILIPSTHCLVGLKQRKLINGTLLPQGGVDKEVKRILKDGENFVRLRDLEEVLRICYDNKNKKVRVYKK